MYLSNALPSSKHVLKKSSCLGGIFCSSDEFSLYAAWFSGLYKTFIQRNTSLSTMIKGVYNMYNLLCYVIQHLWYVFLLECIDCGVIQRWPGKTALFIRETNILIKLHKSSHCAHRL
jgi:hypothetical protein